MRVVNGDYRDSIPPCPSSLSGSFSTDGSLSSSSSKTAAAAAAAGGAVPLSPGRLRPFAGALVGSGNGGSGGSTAAAAAAAATTTNTIDRIGPLQRQLDDKCRECNELQQALHTMTQALQELHWEVRDKSSECEALQQTSMALSDALRESERNLHVAQCLNEHLEFKLSAVGCFFDPGDPAVHDTATTERYRTPAGSGTRQHQHLNQRDGGSAHRGNPSSSHHYFKWRDEALGDWEDDLDFGDERRAVPAVPNDDFSPNASLPHADATSVPASDPQSSDAIETVTASTATAAVASRDDGSSPTEGSLSSDATSPLAPPSDTAAHDALPDGAAPPRSIGAPSELSPAPCQAAFYQVILERDQARRDAERLYKEVKARREQVRTLRGKLNKSTALVELSYDRDDDVSNNDRESSSHLRPLKWLKNTANSNPSSRRQSATKSENAAEPKVQSASELPAYTPKLHAHLPSLDKYVDMMVNNDADKAAGSVRDSSVSSSSSSSSSYHASSIRSPRVRKVVSQLVEL